MSLRFTKLHGLGNDYVYISVFDQQVADAPALARAISDRHRGVGSDGLILVGPPATPGADVRMLMYNADGSRGQMCGNGIRCVAKLAYERGWARRNPLRVQTDAGVLTLELQRDAQDRVQRVRVDMGAPLLAAREIPVALDRALVDVPLVPALPGAAAGALRMTCVSMGNPHAVFFVADVAAVPLADWGPQIERHPLFPERVNAHFVQVLGATRVRMRTWERGSGVTQACGTGAAAVCVAGVLTNRTPRAITAELPGGELELDWDADSGHVFKTGPATEVFSGEWPT
jgi:diaminopimelate epimerase